MAGPKRPSRLRSNNITTVMTEWYGRKWWQDCRKEQKSRLNEKKPTIKQSLAPKKSKP